MAQIVPPTSPDPWVVAQTVFTVVLGVMALIATFGAGYWIYRISKSRKDLSCRVISYTQPFSFDRQIKDVVLKLEVRGREVTKLSYAVLEFRNTGNIPIRLPDQATEYERPITISFEGRPPIIAADVVSKSHSNLMIAVEVDGDTCVIKPVLLNAGYWFRTEVLLEDDQERVLELDYSIEGVDKIKVGEVQDSHQRRRQLSYGILGLASGLMLPLGILFINKEPGPDNIFELTLLIGLFTLLVGSSYFIRPNA